MIYIVLGIVILICIGTSFFLGWKNKILKYRLRQERLLSDRVESVCIEALERAKSIERAFSSYLTEVMNERGEAPPSSCYHSLFRAMGKNGIAMTYVCLDTGHCMRWSFPNHEIMLAEVEKMRRAAISRKEGRLPTDPLMVNAPVLPGKTLH